MTLGKQITYGEKMEEYITSIFAVSAVTAILGLIAYRGGDTVTKFAFSVLVMYVSLVPISGIIDDIKNGNADFSVSLPDYGVGEYSESVSEAFCLGVSRYICSEFSLDESDVSVSVLDFDMEKMTAALVKVTLSGRAVFADKIKIEELVYDAGLGKCEVQIEIG